MGNNNSRSVSRVLVIEGVINLTLLVAKLIVGFATNSLVVLADAIHSLTDLGNNIIAWFVVRLANKPPDESHPYGHRKFEVLAVFALATLLCVVAFELVVSAFRRPDTTEIVSSTWMLGMMLAILMINLATALWQKRMAKRLQSKIIEADAQHTFSDVLTTLGVIVGWQLAANGYPILDSLATLIVAAIIVWMSFSLFRSTLPALVDEAAVPSEDVRRVIERIGNVGSVRRVRSRWVGDTISLDLVVSVDPAMSTSEAHTIADHVEEVLAMKFGISDTTVHIEPH